MSGKVHERDRPCPYSKDALVAGVAFLKHAAEEGWHMRPDEATAEMIATVADGSNMAGMRLMIQGFHEALSKAAPEFEWDK